MRMDAVAYLNAEFLQHQQVAATTLDAVREPFLRLLTAREQAIQHGGKIVFFGNGGSAADAQHLATELAVRYSKDRTSAARLSPSAPQMNQGESKNEDTPYRKGSGHLLLP